MSEYQRSDEDEWHLISLADAIHAFYGLWIDMGGTTSDFAEAVRRGFANTSGYDVTPQPDSPEDIQKRAAKLRDSR